MDQWKIDGKSKENLEKICGILFFFLVFSSFWTVCAYPKLKQQQKIRFTERRALFEQKKMALVLGNKAVPFSEKICQRLWQNLPPALGKSATDLGKSVTDFGKICHRFLGKAATYFGKISHRLWENLPQTLGKPAADFGKISHRLWENQPPTLRKSATEFGEIRHRFCGNPSPTLRKSVTHFGKMSHRLWKNPSPILGK